MKLPSFLSFWRFWRQILVAAAFVAGAAAAEIWLSPGGADTASGAADRPLATPAAALRKARELRRLHDPAVKRGVTILLKGGTYRFHEPLRIRPEDSGTPDAPTKIAAAPGERVVFSGGVEVRDWQRVENAPPGLKTAAEGHIWRAPIPVFNGRRLEFRQLWVDGRKAVRARWPNGEAMERLTAWDRTARVAGLPASAPLPARLEGVEMVMLQAWEIAVLRLQSQMRTAERIDVTFHEPESRIQFEHPWPQPPMGDATGNAPFLLANALEFLDAPGEWFADPKAGWLYYWPREDEDLSRDTVVVPGAETLIELAGTLGRPVRQVAITGIEMMHTTWLRPTLAGHVPLQAGFYLLEAYSLGPKGTPDWRSLDNQAWIGRPPAAVTVRGAQDVSFQRCRFEHLAASGLDLSTGVQRATVEGCVFRDVGINGLVAGYFPEGGFEAHLPYDPSDEREVTAEVRIANNLLTDIANEDWGGVAVIAGFVRDTAIVHNEINHTSYTGISLGWGWTRTANAMRNNLVHANRIHHVATRTADNAGIYTLSNQPGTIVSENVVHSINMSPYVHDPEHWFYLYTDEGSAFITVRDNWCPEERFLQNANGPGNVWTNNGPQVSAKIKAAAGLEPAFRDLLEATAAAFPRSE